MSACFRMICCLWLLSAPPAVASPAPNTEDYRRIIGAMKSDPRGPFARIRWFCRDGSVLAPRPYACAERGGGRQHGEWNDDTLRLHRAGYPIANVMAALTAEDFGEAAAQQRHFRMLVLEQFLIDIDDGWILRGARHYRGALQVEGERHSAHSFLTALAQRRAWQRRRYPLLVEAARLISHGEDDISNAQVRAMATELNRRDSGFAALRNKIHGRPDPGDAARVRGYARAQGKAALKADYEAMAAAIDTLYAPVDTAPLIRAYAAKVRDRALAPPLVAAADRLTTATAPAARIAELAALMATLRDGLAASGHPLDAIDLILALETQVSQAGQILLSDVERLTRRRRLQLMRHFARAAYASGLLTRWELDNIETAFAHLQADSVALARYRRELAYLDRAPGWGARRLALYFEPEIADLAVIEPLAREYIPDRMRGSPLLLYARLLAPLAADAMQLAGVRQELFGTAVASGLRALNPGLGRGVLRTLAQLDDAPEGGAASIVLVDETVAELPPVAGILTRHEGNALSHVQLLARNLGVPNVVVSEDLLPRLRQRLGQRLQLASSPAGVVRIELAADEGGASEPPLRQQRIRIDVGKLDLATRELVPTRALGARDQGVRVGPKAAQVGELTRHFPGQVAPGLAVPFGLFAENLRSQRTHPGGPTLFEWMAAAFDELQQMENRSAKARRTRELLTTIRGWFLTRPLNIAQSPALREALAREFGPDGSFGLFVRSDTNVEDLPGFTGAGINLTVPNVVGIDNLIEAMRQVWASPFSERSFGWRQAIMADPEHVYASVLLHQAVDVDRSGVMVTADLATGARDLVTVAVNEGVGGGVEGQAAETLLIRRRDARVRLLGSATAPRKQVLNPAGGARSAAASGTERLLRPADIDALLAVVARLPGWFGDDQTVADIEFGFLKDRLYLFQIRPFVENTAAARNDFLRSLDAGLRNAGDISVAMNAVPGGRR